MPKFTCSHIVAHVFYQVVLHDSCKHCQIGAIHYNNSFHSRRKLLVQVIPLGLLVLKFQHSLGRL